ncbi:hypothetical protein [Streptomonospora litoralis]|uniref:Uncharacterized protein n=1 Tax=Streptomonospora litoralis TaxID=2498135 RepID=A0A4P6QAZ5_9ACTN|nr:hypothetical protein [Streptomonospora litoralis]QBI56809.1 hypothetical protein EKD16_25340 [Streptomonospora litoralis]
MSTHGDPIELDPGTDVWERQPQETPKRFGQFAIYRDLGRTRSIRETAERTDNSADYLRRVAAQFRWTERAEAFDRHRDRLHQAMWLEERRKAAEADAKVLSAGIGKIAQRLTSMSPSELSVSDMIRMMDVVMRQRRHLLGPGEEIQVEATLTGGDGAASALGEILAEAKRNQDREEQQLTAALDDEDEDGDSEDDGAGGGHAHP